MGGNNYLKALKNIFSLDLRGLAVFRILFGLIILYDIIDRLSFAKAHYTDDGIMPRSVVLNEDWLDWLFSLHLMNGELYWQVILFSIYGVLALCVVFGYRTKTALFLCWLFMHSVHARNSLITTGADNVMRMMAFWALFLPIAAIWSVDKYLDTNKENAKPQLIENEPFMSAGTVAYLVQILSIYFFSVFLKTGNTWMDGTAVYYTLQLEHYTTWFGTLVGKNMAITKFLTYFTMVLEQYGFLLFLIPFKWQWFRFIGVSLYISLHAGFILTMNLGIFPEVCIIAWVACFPPMVWDFLFGLNFIKKLKFSIAHRVGAGIEKLKSLHLLHPKHVITYDGGKLSMIIVSFFMVTVFWWNWMRVDKVEMPNFLQEIVRHTRVNQKWGMFAPNPSRSDGWYVVQGRFSDGSELDLHTGLPVSWEKPKAISSAYANHRWRKYFNNFHRKSKSKFRSHYGKYLANQWKDKLEGKSVHLETFEIFFIEEKTEADFKTAPTKKHSLWKHWTDKKYKEYFYPDEKDSKKEKDTKKEVEKEVEKTKLPKKDARGVIIEEDIPGGQEKIGSSDDAILGGGDDDAKSDKKGKKEIDQNLDGE